MIKADELDVAHEPAAHDPLRKGAAVVTRAGQHERDVPPVRAHTGERLEKARMVLVRPEVSRIKEKPLARQRARAEPLRIDTMRDHTNLLGRHSEMAHERVGAEAAHRHDDPGGVRRPRVHPTTVKAIGTRKELRMDVVLNVGDADGGWKARGERDHANERKVKRADSVHEHLAEDGARARDRASHRESPTRQTPAARIGRDHARGQLSRGVWRDAGQERDVRARPPPREAAAQVPGVTLRARARRSAGPV